MGSHYKSTRLHLRYAADIAATFNATLKRAGEADWVAGGAEVTLRFAAGGGQPPQSHEVLRLDPGGDGRYLTGMPWPSQRPFDEIGVYVATADLGRLAELARAVLAAPPPGGGHADAGGESVELDGAAASWGARDRSPAAEAFVDAARAAIAAAREHPLAAVRADAVDGGLVLRHRGEHPLAVAAGEVHVGRGRLERPPSPLRLAGPDPLPFALPRVLAPGGSVPVALPAPPPVDDADFATPYALVHLRWRPEVPGEPDELDGWMISGPLVDSGTGRSS